jgi:hypothetical protein
VAVRPGQFQDALFQPGVAITLHKRQRPFTCLGHAGDQADAGPSEQMAVRVSPAAIRLQMMGASSFRLYFCLPAIISPHSSGSPRSAPGTRNRGRVDTVSPGPCIGSSLFFALCSVYT